MQQICARTTAYSQNTETLQMKSGVIWSHTEAIFYKSPFSSTIVWLRQFF
jgi:hypothetical protein